MAEAAARTVATIDLNDKCELRIRVATERGARVVDVRLFEDFAGPSKARCPTKRGVGVPLEHIGALIGALQLARDLAMAEAG